MSRAARVVIVASALLFASPAAGHDLRPGVVAMEEVAPDSFALRVTPPQTGGTLVPITPVLPEHCEVDSAQYVCPDGLRGTLVLPGLGESFADVMVYVHWLDGTRLERWIRAGEDRVWIARPGSTAATQETLTRETLGVVDGALSSLLLPEATMVTLSVAVLAASGSSIFPALALFLLTIAATILLFLLGLPPPPVEATGLLTTGALLAVVTTLARHRRSSTVHDTALAALAGTTLGLFLASGSAASTTSGGASTTIWLAGAVLAQALLAAVAAAAMTTARHVEIGRSFDVERAAAYLLGLPAGYFFVVRFASWWQQLGIA